MYIKHAQSFNSNMKGERTMTKCRLHEETKGQGMRGETHLLFDKRMELKYLSSGIKLIKLYIIVG